MIMDRSLFDRDLLQIRARCRVGQSDDQRGHQMWSLNFAGADPDIWMSNLLTELRH